MKQTQKMKSKKNHQNLRFHASELENDPLDQPPCQTQTHNYTDPCHCRQPEREKASHVVAVNQADLQVARRGVMAMGFGSEERRKRVEK